MPVNPHTSVVDDGEPATAPVVALVPDSADARLFIELSSYAADLAEAMVALDLAAKAAHEGEALDGAIPVLIGAAAVAYCRTCIESKVRQPVTSHITIPGELVGVHEMVRAFRNATVAHSQSELATTYPTAVLDPHTHDLMFVAAVTVLQTLPSSVIRRFRTLVAAVAELLDDAITPIRQRLEADLDGVPLDVLPSGPKPTVYDKFARDFEPKSKRRPYPTAQTFYWEVTSDVRGGLEHPGRPNVE